MYEDAQFSKKIKISKKKIVKDGTIYINSDYSVLDRIQVSQISVTKSLLLKKINDIDVINKDCQ